MRRTIPLVVFAFVCLAATEGSAEGVLPQRSLRSRLNSALILEQAERSPPKFVVHTASANPLQALLKQLDDKWSLVLGDQAGTRVPAGELVSLRRVDMLLPPLPAGPQAIFANGDRLPGTVGDLVGDKLAFTADIGAGQPLTLPFSALSVLWFGPPGAGANPEDLRRQLLAGRRNRDQVWLRNGDVLEGNINKLDRQSLKIESAGKETTIERDRLAVVALNSDLVRTLRPKEAFGHLVLANGCRLSIAAATADEQSLTVKTLFGATLQVPLTQVLALDMRQGRAVYLSDLKPVAYRYTPFFPGLDFPLAADASAAGGELRVGGNVYDKGLGTHSQCEVQYALDGAYRLFEAWVGLDERAGRKGSVRIKVLVDGKPTAGVDDRDLTVHDAVRALRVPVAGAKVLTLVVAYGNYPLVQGYVNWADARLLK